MLCFNSVTPKACCWSRSWTKSFHLQLLRLIFLRSTLKLCSPVFIRFPSYNFLTASNATNPYLLLLGWLVRGSSLVRGWKFFFSPSCSDRLWDPPNGYQGLFPGGGGSGRVVKLTIHSYLVPRSRMRGAILPCLQYSFIAWCSVKAQGRLYLYPVTSTCSAHHILLYFAFITILYEFPFT
jgi:hypothetical protein